MMSDEEIKDVSEAKADAIALAHALHTILVETTDAEAARVAIAALQGTQTGRDYLTANPLGY